MEASVALLGEDGVPAGESETMVEVGGTVGCESGVVVSAEVVQPTARRMKEIGIRIERFITLTTGRRPISD